MTEKTATLWKQLNRRIEGHKLIWLERRLDDQKIQHRRNDEFFHVPMVEVPLQHLDAAMAILLAVEEASDDDPRFYLDEQGEAYPHDLVVEEDDFVYDGEVIGHYKDCEVQLFGSTGDYSFRWQRWLEDVSEPYTSDLYGCKSKQDALYDAVYWINWLHYDAAHPDTLDRSQSPTKTL